MTLISTNFYSQTEFSSMADTMNAWGLVNTDLTFIRHEMRTLLLEYINKGEALIEYQ